MDDRYREIPAGKFFAMNFDYGRAGYTALSVFTYHCRITKSPYQHNAETESFKESLRRNALRRKFWRHIGAA